MKQVNDSYRYRQSLILGSIIILSVFLFTGNQTAPLAKKIKTPSKTSTDSRNPFTSQVLSAYLARQGDNLTAGLYDETTGETFLYHPHRQQVTASIVKVDILANLLHLKSNDLNSLSSADTNLTASMIEESDNDAAEALWEKLDYNRGLEAFNSLMGFDETKTNPENIWGLEETTPNDQLKLLKNIVLPSKVLTPDSQNYIRNLMEHTISSQRFGVPNGIPANITVGVKDGWDTESNLGWQVNTMGYAASPKTPYLLVVMTSNNLDEPSGINMVNRVSTMVWNFESHLSSN